MDFELWQMRLVSGILALLSVIISLVLVIRHLQHYNRPHLQRCIVRILLMVPIYAVDSWLSLMFPQYALYFDVLRDCYEAYVLQQFFTLLVEYLRGESNIIRILKAKPPLSHPIPLCCLPRIELGKKFFHLCKVMILQFVLAKPFFALLSVVLSLIPAGDGVGNLYGDGQWRVDRGYLWITGFDNLSVTLAMYFLVLFYLATQEELARYRPVPKFLCIKMVLFVAFWQSCLVSGLEWFGLIHDVGDWTAINIEYFLEDFLITVEMLLIALAHAYAFGHQEYQEDGRRKGIIPLLENFSDVLSQKDMIAATRDTFARDKRRLSLKDFFELSDEQQRKRIKREGWLFVSEDQGELWRYRYCMLLVQPVGLLYLRKKPFHGARSAASSSVSENTSSSTMLVDESVLPIEGMTMHNHSDNTSLLMPLVSTDLEEYMCGFLDFTTVTRVLPVEGDQERFLKRTIEEQLRRRYPELSAADTRRLMSSSNSKQRMLSAQLDSEARAQEDEEDDQHERDEHDDDDEEEDDEEGDERKPFLSERRRSSASSAASISTPSARQRGDGAPHSAEQLAKISLAQQDAVLGEDVGELDAYAMIREQLQKVSAFVKIDDPRRRPVENALELTERHVGSVATQRSLRRRGFLPSLTGANAPELLFSSPGGTADRRNAVPGTAAVERRLSTAEPPLLFIEQSFESSALLEEAPHSELDDSETSLLACSPTSEERKQHALLEARFGSRDRGHAAADGALRPPEHSLRLSGIDEPSVLGTPNGGGGGGGDGRSLNESIDHPLRATPVKSSTIGTLSASSSAAHSPKSGALGTPIAQQAAAVSSVETVEHGDLREFALLAGPAAQMWGWANDMWIAWSLAREANIADCMESNQLLFDVADDEPPSGGQGDIYL